MTDILTTPFLDLWVQGEHTAVRRALKDLSLGWVQIRYNIKVRAKDTPIFTLNEDNTMIKLISMLITSVVNID